MVKGFVTVKKSEDGFYHIKILEGECPDRCCLCKKCNGKMIIKVVGKDDIRDWQGYVIDHMERVGQLCRQLLDDEGLYQAALLHDIGKFGIPERVLFKEGMLNDFEWGLIKRHPVMGYNILKRCGLEDSIADSILRHHERWDGTGYPGGLTGEDIPLLSRYIAVADAYDTMTSKRPYAVLMSNKDALEELITCAGRQLDYNIVDSFLFISQKGELKSV